MHTYHILNAYLQYLKCLIEVTKILPSKHVVLTLHFHIFKEYNEPIQLKMVSQREEFNLN